jgi:hypothetical protein
MRSTDDGRTWSSVRGDLPSNEPIQCVGGRGLDVFAGTWNGGLFASRSNVSSTPEGLDTRSAWLGTNRPSPFRSETEISFHLVKAAPVVARVYGVRGQLVRTLVHAALPAGDFVARWDGRDEQGRQVALGVYACRIEAGGVHASRKMTLAR